ncbi:MAG: RpiB/LacA/LacB family sugar-phosphate isomerase [Bradymonadales bacterium]|nr:MAG: RpiB/LacA/LacB family sugar-phosphate isomerase [Bradymonadales bacterium]
MIFLASDHAGYDLKLALAEKLKSVTSSLEVLGCHSKASCDYPDFASELTEHLLKSPESLGVLICGSGVGMSIAANKIRGVRAAHASDPLTAELARQHNHANVLCLGARFLSADQAWACLQAFLNAKPDEDPRHLRRVSKISELEGRG